MSGQGMRDEIDDAIDGAIAEMLAGEPRVTGASVRAAAGRRPIGLPVWLAIAASLIVGIVLTRGFTKEPDAPMTAASPMPLSHTSALPALSPSIEDSVPATSATAMANDRRAARRSARPTIPEPWEGLDRLVIAPIEPMKSIDAERIGSEALEIPGIEITPLEALKPLDPSDTSNDDSPDRSTNQP